MLKCDKCDALKKVNFNFWIFKVDAIGFIVLSVFLAVPIGVLAYLAENSQGFAYFIAFIAFLIAWINKEHKVIALLLVELLIDSALYKSGVYEFSFMVATAFIFTFIKIGGKIYQFFFMCVNYKLDFEVLCKSCNTVYKKVKLPTQQ